MVNYSNQTLGELDDAYGTSGCTSVCDGDSREIVMGVESGTWCGPTTASSYQEVRFTLQQFEIWFRSRFGFTPARKDDGYAEPEVQRMWVRWKEKQR